MSIPVLVQVYDETRRLAIAGSVVAGGDFRLKKLIPPLEQAGAKVPVFARVGQAVQALVDAKEKESADKLLELATLVSAVLYTQGETGAAGTLEPIETIELISPTTQTSARVLKPLIEALTTTGSGRFELIRDAHAQGQFRDVRLVKPSVQALDDTYPEVADFVAQKVLPLYGKAILPELRARFDLKGKGSDGRRLKLMHELEPDGTRPLVTQALESGSKEVKVAAIACLGAEPEDLRFLLEQTSAKAQDVRQAAYQALAELDHGDAVAALEKALAGKDLNLAAEALGISRSDRLVRSAIGAAKDELAALPKTKDKKEVGQRLARLRTLTNTLAGRSDAASEAFLLELFGQRHSVEKIKGESISGADFNAAVVQLMAVGSPKLQRTLAAAHAELPPDQLAECFRAARHALPAAEVFTTFSPYLTAKIDEKKKHRDPAWVRRDELLMELGGRSTYYYADPEDKSPSLDPRWLDIAVTLGQLPLIRSLARPGHVAAEQFLTKTFEETLKKSKHLRDCYDVVATMARARHPQATEAFVAALDKHGGKADYDSYWFARIVPDLPRSALPQLEALVPKLNDRVADHFLSFLQQLREKTAD